MITNISPKTFLPVMLCVVMGCSTGGLGPWVHPDKFEKVDLPDLSRMAREAYRQGAFAKASEYYEAAFEHNQDDAILAYNLACCYGLQGKQEKAVFFVEQAFRNGFRGLDLFLKDPDFDSVREGAAFKQVEGELKERFKAIGSLKQVAASAYQPYRMRLPADFDTSKAYPLLIGLHGNGGSADGFIAYYDRMDRPPLIYVTPEGQYPRSNNIGPQGHSRSWILPGAPQSMWMEIDQMVLDYLQQVIQQVRSEYRVSSIYLLGYSQGAAFAYTMALKHPDTISGVIGLSGYLMERDVPYSLLSTRDLEQAKSVRIFMGHGMKDAAISVEAARAIRALFQQHRLDVTYLEYEGEHGIDSEVLQAAANWIFEE